MDNKMRLRQFYVAISEDFECSLLFKIFNEYINEHQLKGEMCEEVFALKDKLFRNSVIIERAVDSPFDNKNDS